MTVSDTVAPGSSVGELTWVTTFGTATTRTISAGSGHIVVTLSVFCVLAMTSW